MPIKTRQLNVDGVTKNDDFFIHNNPTETSRVGRDGPYTGDRSSFSQAANAGFPQTTPRLEQPYTSFDGVHLDVASNAKNDDSSSGKKKCCLISVIALCLVAIFAVPLVVLFVKPTCNGGSQTPTISGETVLKEGDRYDITCSGTVSRNADLHLTRISSDGAERLAGQLIGKSDVSDDPCYITVTKTYSFLADKNQNGTRLKCEVTDENLLSYVNSDEMVVQVDAADVRMTLHLNNTTWNPAFRDVNSPEFKTFAEEIERDMDVVFNYSQFSDNYRDTKVLRLEQGSVIVHLVIEMSLTITHTDSAGNTFTVKLNIRDIVSNIIFTIQSIRFSGELNSGLVNTDTENINADITTDSTLNLLRTLYLFWYMFANNMSGFISEKDLPEDACSSQTDIVFLLDASGSIGAANFITMKYFIQNFTAGLEIGESALQLGVVKFSSSANTEFMLNQYYSPLTINEAVEKIRYTAGGTEIGLALEFVRDTSFLPSNGGRMNSTRVIILMTDGKSAGSPDSVANSLKGEGVIIVCIGIGGGVDEDQLNSIAYNSSFVFSATDFDVLIDTKRVVQDASCNNED
ncbi:uncharacterized protein [Argopecten irradians]|uniref:uncharacterized protein n=1 Tax=Argopecten irradians TaxID=31199 RepID=UPI00371794A3